MINLANCKGCAERRALMAQWARGMADWARNPTKFPRPGSKEWFDRVGNTLDSDESVSQKTTENSA